MFSTKQTGTERHSPAMIGEVRRDRCLGNDKIWIRGRAPPDLKVTEILIDASVRIAIAQREPPYNVAPSALNAVIPFATSERFWGVSMVKSFT